MLYQDATETALNSAWNNNPPTEIRNYLEGSRDAATERELQLGVKIASDIEQSDLTLQQYLKDKPELLAEFKDTFEPYQTFRRA